MVIASGMKDHIPSIDYNFEIPNTNHYRLAFNSDWKGYDDEFTDMTVDPITIIDENHDGESYKAITNLPAYAALLFLSLSL